MRRSWFERGLRLSCLGVLGVVSCQPSTPPSSSRVLTKPTATPVAAAPVASEPGIPQAPMVPAATASLDWKAVPTTRTAFHQSIWIEESLPLPKATALVAQNVLNILGGSFDPSALPAAALPKQQVVVWQQRGPDFSHRVVMDMEVCLTRGYLEHFLSRSEAGKDHESIVSAPFDAERLKFALVAVGLTPGKPATFLKPHSTEREYEFKPATGDPVKLYVQYEDEQGKTLTATAQSWIVGARDNKPLNADWVFAGSYRGKSKTFEGEEYEYFGANDGRVVCVTNYGTALLDLPFESSDADPQGNQLGYQANTAIIPPRGTKVRVLFEPKVDGKGKK